jgi:Zn-dependent peptidase ImmA (M78 family)/DNA-binding XRE family transcriptional regulator
MPHGIKVKLSNPKILEWAREEIGLSEAEVANRFNKSEETITSWENGDDAPTFRQLSELANYYKRPLATFFLPSVPPESPKPEDHRTLPGLELGRFSKYTLIAYREVYNMLADVQELFELLNYDIVFSLPTWTMEDNPEEKADLLRHSLNFPLEKQIKEMTTYHVALDIWRSILFDYGVVVRICKMPIEDARAFCLFRDKLSGIGLSNEDREHGKIFSLFHEVCHLALKRPGVSGLTSRVSSPNQEIEQYCDRFSASFLLPSSHYEVNNSLKRLSSSLNYETTRQAANKFKVSKYVSIRRAFDLNYISPDEYWKIYNEFRNIDKRNITKASEDRGGNYHATQISYNGKRYVALVMDALKRHQINSFDVKRLIGLTPDNIEASL